MSTKNRLFAAGCAALLLLALLLFPPVKSHAQQKDVLRLHILANSDGAADQSVKLEVRDALLRLMPACESEAAAEAYVLSHGALLLRTVESLLHAKGFAYGAQLMLGISEFPDRSYAGVLYPAGSYFALRIILGAGEGHNWWCLLFPPLCLVTEDAEPLPDAEDIRFESSLVQWWRARRAES